MPRIKLKPNSPEYCDNKDAPEVDRICHYDGCCEPGLYKAPKARGSREFYYFCAKHIQDYNSSWNYFDGMSEAQIRAEMLKSLYGDRPTWSHKGAGNPTDELHRQAKRTYDFSDGGGANAHDGGEDDEADNGAYKRRSDAFTYHHDSDEYKAMALMGLEPPLDLDLLKKRYKDLAKKNHPDRNGGCEKAEETLKTINIAYKILKDAFGRYEKLMNK